MTAYVNKYINHAQLIDKIEAVKKECFLNYKGNENNKSLYLKIYLNDHYQTNKLTTLFKSGFNFDGVTY